MREMQNYRGARETSASTYRQGSSDSLSAEFLVHLQKSSLH